MQGGSDSRVLVGRPQRVDVLLILLLLPPSSGRMQGGAGLPGSGWPPTTRQRVIKHFTTTANFLSHTRWGRIPGFWLAARNASRGYSFFYYNHQFLVVCRVGIPGFRLAAHNATTCYYSFHFNRQFLVACRVGPDSRIPVGRPLRVNLLFKRSAHSSGFRRPSIFSTPEDQDRIL